MRRIVPFALAVGLALVPALTLAHTELESSDPTDGAVLTEAPSDVTLTFAGEVAEGATFTVEGPSGDEVGTGELDLEVAERNILRGEIEATEPGQYTVAWTVTGEDGHEVTGELSFTYEPDGEPTTPDTAVARGDVPTATFLGALLVLVAAGAGTWHFAAARRRR